jgi:hypothetical protein
MKPLASASHAPARPLASRQLVPNHDLPRFTSSLAKRTHRVRPSEKTAFRAVLGFAPVRPSYRGFPPRRGGLRTPANEASLPPGDRPIRPPRVPSPPMIMLCLGLSTPLPCGRTECVPPRNRLSRYFRAFPRKVILACIVPPRRGGLCTPAMKPLASASHAPARPLASRQLVPNHDLPRFTSSLAKRTHRVRPSEKTAFRAVLGFAPVRPS